jgi:hypothetical protein
MAEAKSGEGDLNFYHALATLIENADEDRAAIQEAVRTLDQATARLKQEFPDYAILRALTEQAEQDQIAICAAIKSLEGLIGLFNQKVGAMPTAIAESVGLKVSSQIKTSLSDATTSITKGVQDNFDAVIVASENARVSLNDAASFAVWKVTSSSWIPAAAFVLGLLLGILFAQWIR